MTGCRRNHAKRELYGDSGVHRVRVLSVFRASGACLTSAAGYRGIQTGTLGDVKFSELLCACGMDTDRVAQLRERKPAPVKKQRTKHTKSHEKV